MGSSLLATKEKESRYQDRSFAEALYCPHLPTVISQGVVH